MMNVTVMIVFLTLLVLYVQEGSCQCIEPTVTNGCVSCTDANGDGMINTDDTCTATCTDATTATTPSATCLDTNSFDAELACGSLSGNAACTVAPVDNGCVLCTDVDGDNSVDVPVDMDTCSVTCDDGFAPSHALATCVAANTAFDVILACEACTDENCALCSAAATCTSCEDGYGVSGGDCAACAVTNCATCPTDNAACVICSDGYRMESSTSCVDDDDSGASSNVVGVHMVLLSAAGFLIKLHNA